MRNIYYQNSSLIALVVVVLLLPGCSKSLSGQSGSNSMEDRDHAAQALAQTDGAEGLSATPSLPPRPEKDTLSEQEAPNMHRTSEVPEGRLAIAAPDLQDVFFEFDQWTLSAQSQQTLAADAEWLGSNPTKKVTIQGHCDERGTSAYNLVLGEKRAQTVRNFLVNLGVSGDRLTMVSYGEERPFCSEPHERCYQQNRRGRLTVGTN